MRYLLPFLLSCTEVSINKIPNEPSDSAVVIVDTTEPSSEPAVEPSVEPMEGIGGYVHYYLQQVACPACMGEANEITVEMNARFHEPINDSYTSWIVPQGQCTQNLTQTVPSVPLMDKGSEIKTRADGNILFAYRTSQNSYYNSWNTDIYYTRDAVHYISEENNYEFASFTSLHGFDSIEPYELRYVDPAYAFSAKIYKSGPTFWWSPNGSNSMFTITLAVYTPDGSSLLGYVACSSGDTGMMTIPGQYLETYPYWSLVAVHMTRHKIELVPWVEQNTYIETHMEWSVIGTGHIE